MSEFNNPDILIEAARDNMEHYKKVREHCAKDIINTSYDIKFESSGNVQRLLKEKPYL